MGLRRLHRRMEVMFNQGLKPAGGGEGLSEERTAWIKAGKVGDDQL